MGEEQCGRLPFLQRPLALHGTPYLLSSSPLHSSFVILFLEIPIRAGANNQQGPRKASIFFIVIPGSRENRIIRTLLNLGI